MVKSLNGLAASGGIAIGRAYLLSDTSLTVLNHYSDNVNHEVSRLHDSFTISGKKLAVLQKRARQTLDNRAASVIDSEAQMMGDPELLASIKQLIREQHVTAEWAISQQLKKEKERVNQSAPDYLKRRLTALNDVEKQLVNYLQGTSVERQIPDGAILVTKTATPVLMAAVGERLRGLATQTGGPTSHFALMTQSMQIPSVVGVNQLVKTVNTGDQLIVDGLHGKVLINPNQSVVDQYQQMAADFVREQQRFGQLAQRETVSLDGHHFTVAANLSLPSNATDALAAGAEGVGLLRTEYLFLGREDIPTEEEQFQAYKEVLTAMPDRRVTIRTLDVGGDKLIGGSTGEANPFLGVRGIRVSLRHQQLFITQLRALLRASVYGRLAIMFPMVATLDEFNLARQLLDQTKQTLKRSGVKVAENIEVGTMVEVPSAILMADQLAREADFFSIGSNDLVQYIFSADRGNEQVADLNQELHPAVLRAIKQAVDAAHVEGKSVSLCGGMAAKQLAIPLIMAMGMDELSVPSAQVASVRNEIGQLKIRQLQPLLHKALAAKNAAEVKRMVNDQLAKSLQL
ncbi:MAG TPA: phosphoenolpyruvate--protein phosphotransferase [Candidatus Limosilactobacillus merdipullorum]|uniref:Phosphoenolpyruvate-protein phosphotransferase n=1 Tax=Candidatus Limosilactobacillus merdipullorum TaxID=2838653 RepID=A0A9D1QQH6_9LACO|nr:phosphoenolpyruvate--protein phosphotransferase [Candidatus Limosilactobacillus merdipullorum]